MLPITLLTRLFTKGNKPYLGALPDNRTVEEKAKDWQAREVFAFGMPVFRTVKENEWKKYQVRNQDGSGSCVANSQAKVVEIHLKNSTGEAVKFSHAPVYQKRANKPQAGMGYPDAPKLQVSVNTCKESDMPSENMTDAQLDSAVLPPNYEDLNDIARPNSYVTVPVNFNDVANYVEANGACIIWIVSDYKNWNKDIPTVGGKANGEVRHSIAVVDAVTFNGVQYLVIEDSWGKFGKYDGQRLITREFFNDAVYMAYSLVDFKYSKLDQKFEPFNVGLQYGQTGAEIARLQDYLRSRGTFPRNTKSTGYYGQITAQAVLAFQITYSVDSLANLNLLKGRHVGPKTLAAINSHL